MATIKPGGLGLKTRLFQIIFESDTRLGKGFDIFLALLIFLSVGIILLDSVSEYHARFGDIFYAVEWGITLLFSLELALRIYCLEKPKLYLKSFYGVAFLILTNP